MDNADLAHWRHYRCSVLHLVLYYLNTYIKFNLMCTSELGVSRQVCASVTLREVWVGVPVAPVGLSWKFTREFILLYFYLIILDLYLVSGPGTLAQFRHITRNAVLECSSDTNDTTSIPPTLSRLKSRPGTRQICGIYEFFVVSISY